MAAVENGAAGGGAVALFAGTVTLPLSYLLPAGGLRGATWAQVAGYYPGNDHMRQCALASLAVWMQAQRHLFTGRVLDFGCGRTGTCRMPQPYRALVSGEYIGVDLGDEVPDGPYDAIICTEVLPYVIDPEATLRRFRELLKPGGSLVLSWTAAWPEIEASSLWRFTQAGMDVLLRTAGFQSVNQTLLFELAIGNFRLPVSHAAVAG